METTESEGAMAVMRRILRETPGARVLAFGVLLAVLVGTAAFIGMAVGTGALFGHFLAAPRAGLDSRAVGGAALMLAAAVIARALAAAWQRWTAAELGYRVRRHWRDRLVGTLLRRGPAGVDPRETSTYGLLATESVDALARMVTEVLPRALSAVAVPPLIVAAAWRQFWIAGLILLGTLPLVPVFMVLVGRAAERQGARQWETLTRLQAHFLDVVEGLPTLQLFNRERHQETVIARVSDDYQRAVRSTVGTAMLSQLILDLFAAISVALVAVAVGLALVAGRMAFAPALTVLILTPEAYAPLRQLGAGFHEALRGREAATALFTRVDQPVPETARGTLIPRVDGGPPAIAFDQVTAGYPSRPRPVLENLSWSVRPGEHWLVVGPNGAGKTTLLYCLLGYVAPEAGTVRVGGHPLNTVSPAWWRSQVGYVAEVPYLVAGTVRDNLLMARPDASEAALWEALAAAEAEAFVRALPDGLETPVGDQGLRLSAGQRQRLGLARLFLRAAPVAILDEPTRHLDIVARRRIHAHLGTFLHGRTAIIVSHHQDDLALGDRVLRLGATGVGVLGEEALP